MPDLENELVAADLVGRRVSADGHHATVLFYGKVGETKGEWLGVEWDDPERGKHQGFHEGVQYFQPESSSPTSSSFIRLNKISLGVNMVEATRERYGKVEGETAGVEEETMANFKNDIGARFVQVVGFDKVNSAQCQIDRLRTISVSNMKVNDNLIDLMTALPSLRDLDLSKNLISCWHRVAKLISQVPIQVLNLSDNRMPVPAEFPVQSFTSLRHLVVGGMRYSWQDIEKVAGDLTNLEILQAHNNQLNNILATQGKFPCLKELDLDDNEFTDWSRLTGLDTIKTLELLRINHNKLTNVKVDNEFRNLKSLQLSHNSLDEWRHIGELDKLGLKELRLRHNPVLVREKESTARSMIVALVSSLDTLNGTQIVREERNWSELDYYKKHGLEYIKIKKLSEPEQTEALKLFSENHRRYLDIVAKFGEPEEAELIVKENNIKSTLVSVKLRCPDLPATADTSKKLPLSMTVAKLKALVGRLYKKVSGGNEVRMYVQSGKNPDQKEELDNDLRDLGFYSIEEGDIILVRWVLDTEL